MVRTSLRIDALEIDVAPRVEGGFRARVASTCVRAYMLKQLSGRRSDLHRDWQLQHEQLHFDISEAFARALARRLVTLEASGATRELAEAALHETVAGVYRDVAAEHERDQERYDRQAGRGHQVVAQNRWAAEVAKRLAEGDDSRALAVSAEAAR